MKQFGPALSGNALCTNLPFGDEHLSVGQGNPPEV